MTSARDAEDFAFLVANAKAVRAQGITQFLHLDQPIGIWNYIRMANEIESAVPSGRLLDWGCGLGQMTYLLRRRGFDVVAFDLAGNWEMPRLPLTEIIDVVWGSHPTKLPFATGSFDAVLSCGVLEHVDEFSQPGNEALALGEIRRVVCDGGHFPIYQLPQKYTWQEAVTRVMKIGYSHPRRFTASEIRRVLEGSRFSVTRLKRNNMFPKNLTGLPAAVRAAYSRLARPLIALDTELSRIPGLNQFAGVLELMARAV